ncbi:hypothetical protein ABPG74_009730 [Tetrahymena malaccensis]
MFKNKEDRSKNSKLQQNGEEKQNKQEELGEISESHDSNFIDNLHQNNQQLSRQAKANNTTGILKEDFMGSYYNNQQHNEKSFNLKSQTQQETQSHKVNFNLNEDKSQSKNIQKSNNNKKNIIEMINLEVLQQSSQQIQYKFQAPYQLALIYITWIFFGFCFILRDYYSESSSNQDIKLYTISGLLMTMGLVGIFLWKFVIIKKKVRLEEISSFYRWMMMFFFLLSQILVMEDFAIKKSISDSWVITVTIVQMSYIQSISRVNLFNLIYIGVSTVYLIVRFQFIVDWEWQSLCQSALICTIIVVHQEKLQVESYKQTKKMLSTNKKAHRLNNFYYNILGMIPEGVALFDKNQSTIFCNKTIKDLFKCKKDQLNSIILGLSTNQQHNPSPQPSPNNNNNQFNGSTHNLQNMSQQYFKSATINQQKEQQQSQQQFLNQQQSLKHLNNNNNNTTLQQNQNVSNMVSNIQNNNSNINDINSLINYPENIKDEVSILINQQSSAQQQNINGSNRLISYKNENNIKNINTSSQKRQSNELNDQIQVEIDKKIQKIKQLDQQKSILTPSFKGPESIFNNADNSNNPTFSKIQTKELPSPIDSKKSGKIPSIEEQQSPAACIKYNNNLQNNQLNSSLPSPQKSNVIVNSNLIYSNIPNSYQCINENPNNIQEPMQSPTNHNHQGFQFEQKGINSNNYMEVCKSVRGFDSNSNNEQMFYEGSVVSNNQLINQSKQQQQQQQVSPKKQQSLIKKPTHAIINASSNRNDDEEESDIDIFNNYLYEQEGQKLFKKKLFNQKKSNDIIQRETKVGDILSDLFNEVVGGRNNSQNLNTANNQNNTNNLDPSIQSPNNQNVISFINQNGNNSNNKDIPLTPSSIKKPEYGKSKTFFSQMNKNTNLGYMQFQEDMIKAQVKWKDQIFVLKFLLLELETSENSSEIFILVLVDPLWQEYYNKRMEEVQKYKMKMFASLSHELRTPLNCTISMLEGLEQFITDPQLIDDYLYPALHSQKLLLNQINDILDFAQIDSGKFKYTFVDFNLEKLLQDCQTLIQMQANVKSIELQLIYDTRLNLQVKSDQNRIRQILLNFLSNSLKFTPENGTIRIIAEPMFINETNRVQKYIRLAVQDTGIGMKPETVQNIFNAFNKTEYESEGMNSQGCGLGLAISQSISKGLCIQNQSNVQLNPLSDYQIPQNWIGIQVESIYSQGSTFSFIIQDMNPKPLQSPSYTHNNSYTHSVLPLDMINEEELANSYISVKNENPENITQNTQRQVVVVPQNDMPSKYPKEDKDHSLIADSACINDGSTYQNKAPQYMEFGPIIDIHYRNSDVASSNNGSPLHKPYIQQTITQPSNLGNTQVHSPQNMNKAGENQHYIHSMQSTSTSTQQSLNKLNQNTQFSNNTQINSLNSIINSNQFQKAINNNHIMVTIEPEEQIKNNLPSLVDNQKSSSTPTSQLRMNFLNDTNQMKYSSSNSISNNHSNSSLPSKILPSSSRLTSNLSRTLTNKSLSKMNSSAAQGFNGYHSKSNLNETEGAKLMLHLQQYIENSICEKQCASILIVDDNQFNILALSRMLQQFFNVPIDKAFDGKQAYEKICYRYQQNKPIQSCHKCLRYEIVFMDIEMPILNGYEVMKELTDFFSESKIHKEDFPYIVACTAHGGDQEQVRAKNSGFDDYISKPIMRNDIQKLLCDWYYQTHGQNFTQKAIQQQGSLMGMNTMNDLNEINQKLI